MGLGEEGGPPPRVVLLVVGDVKIERPSLGLASRRGRAAARASGGRAGSFVVCVCVCIHVEGWG